MKVSYATSSCCDTLVVVYRVQRRKADEASARDSKTCTLTFVAHLDRLVRGVVVDENGRGVVSSRFQDLLFKGAVSSLQQRHPVDTPRRNKETSAGVAALPVHHWRDTPLPWLQYTTFKCSF